MNLHELTNFGPQFLQWFKDSKIIDSQGNPLQVFHGTRRSFDNFERRAESQDSGIFFTIDKEYAAGYSTSFGSWTTGSNIRPSYLSIKNPLYVLTKPTDIELKIGTRGAFTDACIEYFENLGYDGVVVGILDHEIEYNFRKMEDSAKEIVAFYPNQVKSIFEAHH